MDRLLAVTREDKNPSTWFLTRRLFTAGIALTYGIAFGSLGVQLLGLFGSEGIAPLGTRMQGLAQQLAGMERLRVPTLLWFGASDGALLALCWAGLGASLLALAGRLPRYALGACWSLYLSFVCVGSPFLDFQWDALLLEAGLLAILFAPGGWNPWGASSPAAPVEREPSTLVRWLLYGLLFKLMFLSGWVKLSSGDASWRDGTALTFHYWTQPLPHRLSVLASEAPAWFQQASVWLLFTIELGLPCLLLAPFGRRRLRQVVAGGTVLLMGVVFLTGNYGFFNLLTAVLCIPLLDDRAWCALLRRAPCARTTHSPQGSGWRDLVLQALVVPLVLVSGLQLSGELGLFEPPTGPLATLTRSVAPFRSVNAYGLFRVMTTERPEIAIEGSRDGVTWEPYRFRYKPDVLERAPVFAGLHMPRLDWQLWFVGLEHRYRQRSRWTMDLLERLGEGSPSVLGLFRGAPFPDEPPAHLRARVSLYRFASEPERSRGIWWERGESELFLPVLRVERRGR